MTNEQPQRSQPIEIPVSALNFETLTALIESFILREGTDYGAAEISLETKIRQVQAQIEKGDVKVVFEPETETVNLLTKSEFAKLLKQGISYSSREPVDSST